MASERHDDEAELARERLSQLRGVLRLVGATIDGTAEVAQDMHRTISATTGRLLEPIPAAAAVERLHAGVSDGVYACVRGGSRLLFGVLDAVLERGGPLLAPPVALPGPLVGVLHGVVGDRMRRDANPMHVTMHLRHRGAALPLTREALSAALEGASERVVVFVHGLAADESSWELASVRAWGREGVSYAALLAERHGYTTLHVRYNSGLRIAENGRALAALLRALLAEYPGELRELALIGHSMGGLVVRSACLHGHVSGDSWTRRVRDVVCLGAPHRGAPLEKLGAVAAAALAAAPVTAPIARVLDVRSVGIKDLRRGTVRDDGVDDDDPPLEKARYHFLAGTLAKVGPVLGWALGDGLVRVCSATPRGRAEVRRARFDGLHHVHLLNHPRVFAYLESALAE
jgi:pimeloyl-ACP methyl ester carboxylesterase